MSNNTDKRQRRHFTFDSIWKEKHNNDVQGFVCRTLDQYFALQGKLDRLLGFFGIESEAKEDDAYTAEDPADWWRGDDDDESAGPTDFSTYRPD